MLQQALWLTNDQHTTAEQTDRAGRNCDYIAAAK